MRAAHKFVSLEQLDRGSQSGAHRPRPLAECVPPGRLVELCGDAPTTAATALLVAAQQSGETCVWIQPARGELYPPDLAAAGVDVEALIVVHIPDKANLPGPAGQCRAAELLLRSGGFGLVILDFAHAEPKGSSNAWQGRLLGLARQHEARLLILRRAAPDSLPSLGPLVSLRIASRVERAVNESDPPGFRPRTGHFLVHHEVVKNKSGAPIEPSPETIRGPWGMC